MHSLSFSQLHIRLFKILLNFLHIWNAIVRSSKMYIWSFCEHFFFCKHFYCKTRFCNKKINFCKFANFSADSKSRAEKLSIWCIIIQSHFDIKHEMQCILVFKYPSRDRVKQKKAAIILKHICSLFFNRFFRNGYFHYLAIKKLTVRYQKITFY